MFFKRKILVIEPIILNYRHNKGFYIRIISFLHIKFEKPVGFTKIGSNMFNWWNKIKNWNKKNQEEIKAAEESKKS